VDETMRLDGKFYLQSFMKEHIDRIFMEQKLCEIDAARLTEGGDITGNLVWAYVFFKEDSEIFSTNRIHSVI
jgi:hypothetical protein